MNCYAKGGSGSPERMYMTSNLLSLRLLDNKDENSVVACAYMYKAIKDLFSKKLTSEEVRNKLWYNNGSVRKMCGRHSFYADWLTNECWKAESGNWVFTINFITGSIKMYHRTKEVYNAPVYFQLMIVCELVVTRVVDNLIGA